MEENDSLITNKRKLDDLNNEENKIAKKSCSSTKSEATSNLSQKGLWTTHLSLPSSFFIYVFNKINLLLYRIRLNN